MDILRLRRRHQADARIAAYAVLTLIFLSRLVFPTPSVHAARRDSRPNVVVILMDDLGYGDVACFGAPDVRSPNVDRLAREGVRLTDNYCSAPMCSPSRAAFTTGRYQQRCGIERDINTTHAQAHVGLPTDETSLARMLAADGYATGLVGKWHLGTAPEFGPNAHGFGSFYGVLANCDYYTHRNLGGGKSMLYDDLTPVTAAGYLTDILTDHAVGMIDEYAKGDAPFFLEVAYTAVHVPHEDPDDPTDIRTRETKYVSTRPTYVKIIERADAGIGRILDALDRAGISRDTLVVFASDNGGDNRRNGRNEPLRGGKYQLYEGGLRSPTLLRWPGVLPAGATSDQASITMDLTATILAAAGTAPSRPLDGIDLLPTLRGDTQVVDRELFWRNACARDAPVRAARVGSWKLLEYRDHDELYDLTTDVGERHDVLAEHADVAASIHAKLKAWGRDVDATPHRFTVACQ